MGYKYNATFNVETCGTVTLVNSLIALKKVVYDDREVTIEQMKDAVKNNFGFKSADEVGSYSLADQEKRDESGKYDRIHFLVLSAPKYGNDDPYADVVMQQWEEWLCPMCADLRVAVRTSHVPVPDLRFDARSHGCSDSGFA